MTFDDTDKLELFDLINSKYFSSNFGTLSKSELELCLFTFYYHKLVENSMDDDFLISVNLGITQSRVRSLKEKMALRTNAYNDSWIDDFKSLIRYAKYDDVKHLVKLHIPNVNTIIQLRYFLEKNHLYDEYQLNPKLFQCRAEIFLEILELLYGESIDSLNINISKLEIIASKDEKELTALEKIKAGKVKEGLSSLLHDASKELIIEVIKSIPGGNIISALLSIIK